MVLGTGIAVALGALMAGGDDPPFELCGMYGWKYKNGRPTPIRRKPDAGKERAYTHDHPTFGAEVVDHLKEHYKGAHYPACKSLVFIPTKDGEAHRDSVQGLIDASYLPPMTDDPCMASFVKRAHEQGRVLPWRYLHYLRTLRATGYNVDLSQDFLDEHNRLLWNAELPDDAELANALYRDCAHVVDAPGRTTNAEAEPFILDNFLESRGQRTFLLGTHDALNEGYRANKNLVLSPWLPIDERYGTFGWNLTINKASMQCFAKEAKQRNWDVPFVVKLNHEPGYYQRIDFFTNADGTAKPDSQSQYLGFFLVRYDRNDEGSELCNSEHLRVDEDIPHESPASYYVMLVFMDTTRSGDDKYKIVNFRRNIVNWGEFADAKRVTYVELRQLMCIAKDPSWRFYVLLKEAGGEYRKALARHWLHGFGQFMHTQDDWILLLLSPRELSTEDLTRSLSGSAKALTLRQCHIGWDDLRNTYGIYPGHAMPETNCMEDPGILRRDIVRDMRMRMRIKAIEGGAETDFRELVRQYDAFVKEHQERMQTPEFRKRMKALASPDENYVLAEFAHTPKRYSFNTSTGDLYRNGKPATNAFNTISPVSFRFLRIVNQVKPGKILVVAHNIHVVELLAYIFQLTEITFLLHNPLEVGSVLMLKRRFPGVRIYFVGNNVDLTLYETAVKLGAGQKFDTIVFDNGLRRSNESHNCCTALLTALCYVLLADEGRALYYTLAERDDAGYRLLSALHSGFAAANTVTRPLFSVHERLPMWVVLATPIRKKLDNASKTCIELLRSATYDLEPKTPTLPDISSEFNAYMMAQWRYALAQTKQYVAIASGGGPVLGGVSTVATTGHEERVPILVDDLVARSIYEPKAMDHSPRCHWGQKKLLLSEIQFLTRVRESVGGPLSDYALVYVGSANGLHLPVLYELFPGLTWLLYDPAKFSKNAYEHPQGLVQIFNDFFTDASIAHALEHAGGRKIIFVSDIRVTPSEEDVQKDMINQARWGVALDADFMLLKFRLPYESEHVIHTLDLPADRVNVRPTPEKGFMQYLKGDVYLQLYPPPYSAELRLYVEKKDGKYDLATYDSSAIERKLFWYHTVIRSAWTYADSKRLPEDQRGLPMRAIAMIPGFDTGIESTGEYIIVRDYLRAVGSDRDPVLEFCRLDLWLQELTGRSLLSCVEITNRKSAKGKKERGRALDERVELWEKMYRVQLAAQQRVQRKMLETFGERVFGGLLPRLQKQLPKESAKTYMEI